VDVKRSPEQNQLFRTKLLAWYDNNAQPWPWRQLWRQHRNPYHVWVSEIMLQQTLIKAALPAYLRFLETFPEVTDLAKASEERVKQVCQGLGYYRRFVLLHQAAKVITSSANNQNIVWPNSYEAWQKLPGVGPYTASALASITLDQAVAVVDGNVERVICRLDDIREPVNLARLKPTYARRSQELLSHERPGDYNQAMMELGQRLCTPTSPKCQGCPVSQFCQSFALGSQALAPGAKIKRAAKNVALRLVIVERKNKVAVFRRNQNEPFLKGTLGLLTLQEDSLLASPKVSVVGRFRHSITNHRLEVEVLLAKTIGDWATPESWVAAKELDKHLVANLDRKAVALYLKSHSATQQQAAL